jgi:hypothetical protein
MLPNAIPSLSTVQLAASGKAAATASLLSSKRSARDRSVDTRRPTTLHMLVVP